MDYTGQDVQNAAKKIKERCPHLLVDDYTDYGFHLAVLDPSTFVETVLFQPGRFHGEARIITTDQQLEEFINRNPPPSPKV